MNADGCPGAQPSGDGVLVVGYGNTLRGDDAVGPRVAEVLASDQLLPGATIVVCHQLAPELADEIVAARLVVLIDARQHGDRPGDVRIEQVVGSCRPLGSHAVDVSAVVDLAERVYGNAPPVVVVSVSAERFDLGAGLSSAVASALPRVVDAVVAVVESHTAGARRRDQGPVGAGHRPIRRVTC
ncbi:MAG: hydrogenase maturation protease [Ilumatobacteraceae bacterium]